MCGIEQKILSSYRGVALSAVSGKPTSSLKDNEGNPLKFGALVIQCYSCLRPLFWIEGNAKGWIPWFAICSECKGEKDSRGILRAPSAAERTALKDIIAKIDLRLTELSYMTTGAYMTPDASEQFTWLSELKNMINPVNAKERAEAKAE